MVKIPFFSIPRALTITMEQPYQNNPDFAGYHTSPLHPH
jgi:hypothetical protein